MLTSKSPAIVDFLAAWHENGRAAHDRSLARTRGEHADFLAHDVYNVKRAIERRKYILLDKGPANNWSGVFMVDRATGAVHAIKGYGVAGHVIGQLEAMTASYRAATMATV